MAYTADGNLFACGVESGTPRQLTFDGGGEILNGYASWVYFEEILGRASNYRAFEWSPDGKKIAFLRFDESRVPQFPIFDAAGAYGRLEMQRYPKPGFPNPAVKIGIVSLAGKGTDWISFADGADHYLTFLAWGARGDKAYVQWLNRGQDELRLYEYDLAGKKLRQVYQEKQKTWVDLLEEGSFSPLAGGGFLLLSSKSGWSHLYRVRADGPETALTSGEWSVSRIEAVDEKHGQVFFSADKEASTRSDLYRVALGGGSLRRLTAGRRHASRHRLPGRPFFFDRFSSLRQPALHAARAARSAGHSAPPG